MRIIYFILLLSLIFNGCTFSENEEVVSSIDINETHNENEENTDINEVSEQIETEEIHVFDNGIYFDREAYKNNEIPVYFEKEEDGEIVREYTWLPNGYIFEAVNHNKSLKYLESASHLEIFTESSVVDDRIIGWFESRIVIGGYTYYLDGGRLLRISVDGGEEELLVGAARQDIRYKDGYIYYISDENFHGKEGVVYRINLDGSVTEQVSNQANIDYCLAENGLVHLVEKYESIHVIYEEIGDNKDKETIAQFDDEDFYLYQLVGVIDDTVYICSMYNMHLRDNEVTKIYACSNGSIELIHTSEEKSHIRKYRPFVHGEYIYYWTPEGIYELNPIDGSSELIAEGIYGFHTAP